MKGRILNQFVETALVGDATTDHALVIRRWLLELGFSSEIYAEHCVPELEEVAKPANSYTPNPEETLLIYHHAIGAAVVNRLLTTGIPLLLIYHNITPADYFTVSDPAMARQMNLGREQLTLLRPYTRLALGASDYSKVELVEAGFPETGVLPIVLDERFYVRPSSEAAQQVKNHAPVLLFVGRLAPNKKQEDLIKLLYFYKRIESEARLILVGSQIPPSYTRWLQEFAAGLDLLDAVAFTDHVSNVDLQTYYQRADIFVSMSEHEGFGKPLIESMYYYLPVLAYAAAAVPYTMANAGVLFREKHYEALAEMANMIVTDNPLRQKIISGQISRVSEFLEPNVRLKFVQLLKRLELQ